VKVFIDFPNFGVTRNNVVVDQNNKAQLIEGYNLFTIADFITMSGGVFDNNLRNTGAIVLASVLWNCDLNQPYDQCQPAWSFTRLDGSDSPGFNYRYLTKTPALSSTEPEYRTLYKVYGVRVVFDISGKAGRFGIVPLLLAIGSGIGLLSISTLICDFILQKFLPDRERYVAEKFQHVAESGMPQMSPADILEVNALANSGATMQTPLNTTYERKDGETGSQSTGYNYR
jgi:hypothetical protein